MVNAILADAPQRAAPEVATSVLWINDGGIGNFGWLKLQDIDFSASYDFDVNNFTIGTSDYHVPQPPPRTSDRRLRAPEK